MVISHGVRRPVRPSWCRDRRTSYHPERPEPMPFFVPPLYTQFSRLEDLLPSPRLLVYIMIAEWIGESTYQLSLYCSINCQANGMAAYGTIYWFGKAAATNLFAAATYKPDGIRSISHPYLSAKLRSCCRTSIRTVQNRCSHCQNNQGNRSEHTWYQCCWRTYHIRSVLPFPQNQE